MPSVWTQVGLHCNTVTAECPFDVAGYSFAGMPGVVIGHNARISWGLTNLAPDVSDFFLEKVSGDTYQVDGKNKPLTTRTETIKVAGGDPVTITVRSTKHGPLSPTCSQTSPSRADLLGAGREGAPRHHVRGRAGLDGADPGYGDGRDPRAGRGRRLQHLP